MNPVVRTIQDDGNHVVFQLTPEDHAKLRQVSLQPENLGRDDVIMHRMCIMQAVSMVTVQADLDLRSDDAAYRGITYTDDPVCVSSAIRDCCVNLNDKENLSQAQRNQLKGLVDDILNTAPVCRRITPGGMIQDQRDVTPEYRAAEKERERILGQIDDYYVKHDKDMPVAQQLRLIREAAAVFKADAPTVVLEDTAGEPPSVA